MAENLSAENFLHILRRFVAQRRYPKLVLSDNASQFQVVFNSIMEENSNFLAERGMAWKNTIPRALWSGRVYERLIGLTKRALRRAIGRKLLKEGELITLIAEIEGILNTRPLTYVGFEDYNIIRPIDFISSTASLDIPIDTEQHRDEYIPYIPKTRDKLIDYWTNSLKTLDGFWKLWRDEYLTSLRERMRTEVFANKMVVLRTTRENEIVLLSEPEVPRGTWKLAKIIKLHSDRRGITRSATIQMPNDRQLYRAISMLYPMEIESPNDTQGKTEEEMIKTLEEPIAIRTRRARKLLNVERTSKPKFLRTLFVLNVITLMIAQVQAMSNCTWKSGIPFNIPEKWNCESITNQIVTLHKADVYTTVCTKALLRLLLSMVSDQTVTSAITPQLCRAIYANRQDRINAELELLAHRHEETFYQPPTSDPTLDRQRNSFFGKKSRLKEKK
uniref:Integrase catalytic domain-containing protein n=1 Tax=Loa loa TaxID=7209 RepID=A0A1I7V6C0_LOALO